MPDIGNERAIAAHHEAGHAVAATMRGGSTLTSVELSEVHGEGITWHNGHTWDFAFIAYAGMWAEARLSWPRAEPTGEDGDGLTFDDYVTGVYLTQPDDAAIVSARQDELRSYGLDPERLREAIRGDEITWGRELEHVWPVVCQVARMLLDGETVTASDVLRLLKATDRTVSHD